MKALQEKTPIYTSSAKRVKKALRNINKLQREIINKQVEIETLKYEMSQQEKIIHVEIETVKYI